MVVCGLICSGLEAAKQVHMLGQVPSLRMTCSRPNDVANTIRPAQGVLLWGSLLTWLHHIQCHSGVIYPKVFGHTRCKSCLAGEWSSWYYEFLHWWSCMEPTEPVDNLLRCSTSEGHLPAIELTSRKGGLEHWTSKQQGCKWRGVIAL